MKLFFKLAVTLTFVFALFAVSLVKIVTAQSCTGGQVKYGNGYQTCTRSSNGASCTCGTTGCDKTSYNCTGGGVTVANCSTDGAGSCSSCVNITSWGQCSNGARCAWNGSYSCSNSCSGGYYCNGTAITGTHGQTGVCGGGNINYGCNNGTWYSQGTFCTLCATPVINTNSCAYPGPTANIGWNAVTNATYYALRINDTAYGWNGACSTPSDPNGGNFCANVSSTSYSWTATPGHSYTWWVHSCGANGVCSNSTSASFTAPSPSNTPTPTPSSTPTPTPTPVLLPYYKMKDTSFYKIGAISSNFPATYSCPASQYDSSDTCTGGYFNQGQAGTVISSTSSISGGSGGTALSGGSSDIRNWTGTISSGINAFTPSSFLNYTRAKKNTTAVSSIGDIPSGSGGTYSLDAGSVSVASSATIPRSYTTIIVTGDLAISTDDLGKDGVTFIVSGNVTLTGSAGTLNSSNRPFAVISTGTITFANTLTEADGLFVGNAVDFGSGSTPLKIVGNVSSVTASSLGRDRVSSKATMFIVFDPKHYMNIVDKVSTVKSSWTQLQ